MSKQSSSKKPAAKTSTSASTKGAAALKDLPSGKNPKGGARLAEQARK